MRTTLEIPDDLFQEVKLATIHRGVTLKVFLRRAVENELRAGDGAQKPAEPLRFPLLRSKKPGSLKITNAEIDELLG